VILVRCVTEHEYGERGSAGDREMGGKIAWLYTLQAKLFPRTE
jgi:hypothetical protein